MTIKRLTALFIAVIMIFSMIPYSSAADTEIVATEILDLGDGVTCEVTTTVIACLQTRAGEQITAGSKTGTFRQGSTKIGEFSIYGEFSYNGSSAKAIADDWYATVTSGYDYEGSSYCSGASVKGSCTFTGNGIEKTAELKLTCDKNGNLS